VNNSSDNVSTLCRLALFPWVPLSFNLTNLDCFFTHTIP
jgi:hypothetical protein